MKSTLAHIDPISTQANLICWIFPIILTILPLSTNRFGCIGEEYCWCFLADRNNSPSWSGAFWVYACFYAWVWGALIGFFLFLLNLFSQRHYEVHCLVLSKLIGYPIIIFVCWIVASVHDVYLYFHSDSSIINNLPFDILFNCLPALQGTFTTALFIYFFLSSNSDKGSRVRIVPHSPIFPKKCNQQLLDDKYQGIVPISK